MADLLFKTIPFKVRSNEVDANRRLTLPALVNYFQEAASLHIIDLNVTAKDLLKHHLMWVLNRMKIEVIQYPSVHDELRVDTFPSGFDRFFFYRDFGLYNRNGDLIARATSTWLVVDVNLRKLAPVPHFLKEIPANTDERAMPVAKGRIHPVLKADFELPVTVRWFDLDPNNHTNNTNYFRWIVESMPVDWLQTMQVSGVDIIFKMETTLGDSLVVQTMKEKAADKFYHQIINENGDLLIQAETEWRKMILAPEPKENE